MLLAAYDRLLRGLRAPGAAWLAVGLGVALSLPSLQVGLYFDDLSQQRFVLEHLQGRAHGPWWNMFDMLGRGDPGDVPRRIASGLVPWWTSPKLVIAFLRPLAVASHYVDYGLWPEQPWLMHLHNLAWYGLAAGLAALLYRRVAGSSAVAGLAALLYAIDEAHAAGVSWIASRNTLLTATFVLLTLLAWLRARRDPTQHVGFSLAAAASLLCAHASSEGGLACWPYLLAFALVLDRGPLFARLGALWPLAVISGAWLALAARLGYQLRGGATYVDPRSDPLLFARVVTQRLPELLRGQLGLPLQLEQALSPSARATVIAGVFALLAVSALLAWPLLRARRSACFFALGFAGSALLACATIVEPRQLFIVGIGAHGLVAELIASCVRTGRRSIAVRIAFGTVAALLLIIHVPIPLALSPFAAQGLAALDQRIRASVRALPAQRSQPGAVMLLNTYSYLDSAFVTSYAIDPALNPPRFVYVLGASRTPVKLSRPTRDALVLEPEGGYLRELTSQGVRDPREPFLPGQVIPVLDGRIVIERITLDGRPARVRIEPRDLSNPQLNWAAWNDTTQRYERVALPEVGEVVWLPGVNDDDARL